MGQEQEKEEEKDDNDLIKNRLIFRNKKNKDYLYFNTKDDKLKNKSVLRNLSSESSFNEKYKIKNLKIKKPNSTLEVNNLGIMNLKKKLFNKKKFKYQ